jgi:short-subunit dehydrogenase
MDMSGKVLIYGRGGGIGSFVASSLAQNGDGLHFTGRDEHKLKAVTEMSKSLTEATSFVDLSGASGKSCRPRQQGNAG